MLLHHTSTITAVGKHWLVTYRHFRVYSSNGTLHTPWFQDWNGKVSCVLCHPNSCETPPFQCCNNVSDCSVKCAIGTIQKICNDRIVGVAIYSPICSENCAMAIYMIIHELVRTTLLQVGIILAYTTFECEMFTISCFLVQLHTTNHWLTWLQYWNSRVLHEFQWCIACEIVLCAMCNRD